MAQQYHRASRYSLLVFTWILLVTAAPGVHAAKRIVVLAFGGLRGFEATNLITRNLGGQYDLLSRGKFMQEAQELGVSAGSSQGRSTVARALRVAGIIGGTISRVRGQWLLNVVVYSGHSGRAVATLSFPLRTARIDLITARKVAQGIHQAMRRARTGPSGGASSGSHRPRVRPSPPAVSERIIPVPRPRPSPRPPPAAAPVVEDDGGLEPDTGEAPPRHQPVRRGPNVFTEEDDGAVDNLGFEVKGEGRRETVATYDDRRERRRSKRATDEEDTPITKKRNARHPWETILGLSVGLLLVKRSFDFNDPHDPANPPNYASPMVAAIQLEGEGYPLALFGRGPLANLGLVGSYYRVLVLKSQLPGFSQEPVATTLHQFEGGIRYRWNILSRGTSPTIKAGLSFGRLGFVIHWDSNLYQVPLPNIAYLYLKLNIAALEFPFLYRRGWSLGALANFDYLYVFSAGDIERTDSGGYGKSTTGGIDLGGGVYVTVGGFFFKLGAFYRRMFFAFDNRCYKENMGCKAAGGALDIYLGFSFLGGYAF